MKTSITSLFIMTVTTTPFAANAGTGWAASQVWQAPVVTTSQATLLGGNKELNSTCDAFELMNAKFNDMPIENRREVFESERKSAMPSQFPQTLFSVEIKTDLPADGKIISGTQRDQLTAIAQARAKSEERVFFTQSLDSEIIDINSISLQSVQSDSGSLTELASTFGSEPSVVKFIAGRDGGVTALVSGKDLACDIIRGRVTLQASVNGYARLSIESQVKLKVFLGQMSDIGNQVTAKYSRLRQRAASLGFRLSALYASQNGITNERAETAMLNALDMYFDPTTLAPRNVSVNGISDPFKVAISLSLKQQ